MKTYDYLKQESEDEFGTLWRYRVGSYRIIADIQDQLFIVVVVKAGKRNDVYKR